MIDLYTPDIKYGKWLNKADTRSDEIAAVVTYNTKYKVGDLVEFTDSVNHYNFRIIGMLDKTAQTINTMVIQKVTIIIHLKIYIQQKFA